MPLLSSPPVKTSDSQDVEERTAMARIVFVLSLMLAGFLVTSSAGFAEDVHGLRGIYWSFADFSGSSVVSIDQVVDNSWGTAAPKAGIEAGTFSVSWTGFIAITTAGSYVLTTEANDGVRLIVDGKTVIDDWGVRTTVSRKSVQLNLAVGAHALQLDYMQAGGAADAATCRFLWSPNGQPEAVVPAGVLRPAPEPLMGTGTGLLGSYFPLPNFAGSVVTRRDPVVNFTWPAAPGPVGIPADNFSVAWDGEVQALYSGPTTFLVGSDDGNAVFLDGKLLMDNWSVHALSWSAQTVTLVAGQRYKLRVVYYDTTGTASAILKWRHKQMSEQVIPASQLYPDAGIAVPTVVGKGTGLVGKYFANKDFTGASVVATDPSLLFDWGLNAPVVGIPAQKFSAMWSGQILPQFSEIYTFSMWAADGVIVTINGKTIIDNWSELNNTNAASVSGSIALTAGAPADIQIRYFTNAGSAVLHAWWSSPSTKAVLIPTSQLFPTMPLAPVLDLKSTQFHGESSSIFKVDKTTYGIVQSYVSPMWVEGNVGTTDGAVSAWIDGAPIRRVQLERPGVWYATESGASQALGVSLKPAAIHRLDVRGSSVGASSMALYAMWRPLDLGSLPYGLESVVIRQWDSLLVTQPGAGALLEIDPAYSGLAFKVGYSGVPGQLFPMRFGVPGVYRVQARIDGVLKGSIKVTVIAADIPGLVACQSGFKRLKAVTVNPAANRTSVEFTAADPQWMQISDNRDLATGKELIVRPMSRGDRVVQARLGSATGPIITEKAVNSFLMSTTAEFRILVTATYPDGSRACAAELVMEPRVPDLSVKLWTFKAGVTLDDSSASRIFSSNLFVPQADGSGRYAYKLLCSPKIVGGACHGYRVYQDGVQISY